MQFVLAVAAAQLVLGQREIGEPGEEFRIEDLGAAVKLLPASQIISFLVKRTVRA